MKTQVAIFVVGLCLIHVSVGFIQPRVFGLPGTRRGLPKDNSSESTNNTMGGNITEIINNTSANITGGTAGFRDKMGDLKDKLTGLGALKDKFWGFRDKMESLKDKPLGLGENMGDMKLEGIKRKLQHFVDNLEDVKDKLTERFGNSTQKLINTLEYIKDKLLRFGGRLGYINDKLLDFGNIKKDIVNITEHVKDKFSEFEYQLEYFNNTLSMGIENSTEDFKYDIMEQLGNKTVEMKEKMENLMDDLTKFGNKIGGFLKKIRKRLGNKSDGLKDKFKKLFKNFRDKMEDLKAKLSRNIKETEVIRNNVEDAPKDDLGALMRKMGMIQTIIFKLGGQMDEIKPNLPVHLAGRMKIIKYILSSIGDKLGKLKEKIKESKREQLKQCQYQLELLLQKLSGVEKKIRALKSKSPKNLRHKLKGLTDTVKDFTFDMSEVGDNLKHLKGNLPEVVGDTPKEIKDPVQDGTIAFQLYLSRG